MGTRPDYRSPDDFLRWFVKDFAEGDAVSALFPLRWFATVDNSGKATRRRETIARSAQRYGSYGQMMADELRGLIRKRHLVRKVDVTLYDDWDLRVERPGHSGERPGGLTRFDGRYEPSEEQQVYTSEFLFGFLWDLEERQLRSSRFAIDDYIACACPHEDELDGYMAHLDENGGAGWVIYEILGRFLGHWDESGQLLARYYGPLDVRVDRVESPSERRFAERIISELIADAGRDGRGSLDVDAEDWPDLLRETEERGQRARFSVEEHGDRELRLTWKTAAEA